MADTSSMTEKVICLNSKAEPWASTWTAPDKPEEEVRRLLCCPLNPHRR